MACALAFQTHDSNSLMLAHTRGRTAQHTANVLVEANVMLNSSAQRVHVNRTHASNVLVAEAGRRPEPFLLE